MSTENLIYSDSELADFDKHNLGSYLEKLTPLAKKRRSSNVEDLLKKTGVLDTWKAMSGVGQELVTNLSTPNFSMDDLDSIP